MFGASADALFCKTLNFTLRIKPILQFSLWIFCVAFAWPMLVSSNTALALDIDDTHMPAAIYVEQMLWQKDTAGDEVAVSYPYDTLNYIIISTPEFRGQMPQKTLFEHVAMVAGLTIAPRKTKNLR